MGVRRSVPLVTAAKPANLTTIGVRDGQFATTVMASLVMTALAVCAVADASRLDAWRVAFPLHIVDDGSFSCTVMSKTHGRRI